MRRQQGDISTNRYRKVLQGLCGSVMADVYVGSFAVDVPSIEHDFVSSIHHHHRYHRYRHGIYSAPATIRRTRVQYRSAWIALLQSPRAITRLHVAGLHLTNSENHPLSQFADSDKTGRPRHSYRTINAYTRATIPPTYSALRELDKS